MPKRPNVKPIIDKQKIGQGFDNQSSAKTSWLRRLRNKTFRDPRTTAVSICSMVVSAVYLYHHPETFSHSEHLMPHVLNILTSLGFFFTADSNS
jgi:hypothetical protein